MLDNLMRTSPSIVLVMFFGWLPLLVRGAFSKRSYRCLDCGATTCYKTAGSWAALCVLCVLVLCVVLGIVLD